MTTIQRVTPGGTVIFCDDIRFEQFGKYSLIGVYEAEIVFSSPVLPVVLPKLGIAIRYIERPGESTEPVTVSVFVPGSNHEQVEVAKVNVATDDLRSVQFSPIADEPELQLEKFAVSFIPLVLAPFNIMSFGRIAVTAFRGSDEIRLGGILLRPARPEDLQSIFANVSPPLPAQSPPAVPAS
jgi:hypothetical protein